MEFPAGILRRKPSSEANHSEPKAIRHSEAKAKNLSTHMEILRAEALRMTNTTPPFMSEYGKINRPNSDERSEVFVY